MKGAAIGAVLLILAIASGPAGSNPALPEPAQSEDFCNHLMVSGTGVIYIDTYVEDKRMGLEYFNVMSGDGHLEMDATSTVSNSATNVQGMVNGTAAPLNLYETNKMSYSGTTPLVGMKYIHSNAFYGGIGAEVQETFEVTEMEKIHTTYFASTDPATLISDPTEAENLRRSSPAHLVGMETKNSFNGTWETNARWHKIFYKDIKEQQYFSGEFEVENTLKFHENPAAWNDL